MSSLYAGLPPDPATLLTRFNFDPWLVAALVGLGALHAWYVWRNPEVDATARHCAALGWSLVAVTLMSPLGPLSFSLFSARVAQHALLTLVAAPLIAMALPAARGRSLLWPSTAAFLAVMWFWHMPIPDRAAVSSGAVHWLMQASLLGSALMLWRALLHHAPGKAFTTLGAGTFTAMHVGVLGGLLALSTDPLYAPYLSVSWDGGLTPLQDQQLGGAMLWVPGLLMFLWMSPRALVSCVSESHRPLPRRAGAR